METIMDEQYTEEKTYNKPAIIIELFLDTRAGSPLGEESLEDEVLQP